MMLLPASIVSILAVFLLASTGCNQNTTFDVAQWQRVNDATLAPYKRRDLLTELLADRSLHGLARTRIVELLGTPSYEVRTTGTNGMQSLNAEAAVSDSLFYSIFDHLRTPDSVHTLTLTVVLSSNETVNRTLATYESAIAR